VAETGRRRLDRATGLTLVVLALLSAQFLAFGLWEAWRDAPTNDEEIYLAAGVTAWTKHDLRLNNEHPPLPKLLAALPVLLARPEIPEGTHWRQGDPSYTKVFVDANAENLRTLVFLNRLVPLLEGLLVGLGCFVLGWMLFGRTAGLVASAAWLTMAVPLSFSHLNGLDVPMALFAIGGCLALLWFVRAPSWRTTAIVGVVGGLGLLTRWTALALVPVFALVVLAAGRRRWSVRLLQAASVLLIAWVVLWGGYRIVAPQSAPVVNAGLTQIGLGDKRPDGIIATVMRVTPLPKEFRAGYEMQQVLDGTRKTDSYIFGEYHPDFTWWFWPATVLVKVPFTTIALMVLGPLGWFRLSRRRVREGLLALVVPLGAITAATYVQAPQEIGVRYLLPVLALAAVAASPLVLLFDRGRAVVVVAGAAVVLQLVLFYTAVPGSIAWTNPGFRPGYEYVADSSFDIGQDLYVLQDWSAGRDVWLWQGFGGLAKGKTVIDLSHPQPIQGTIAINSSALVLYYHQSLSWLRGYCPTEVLGDTILVYQIKGEPDLRPGPDAPAELCPGRWSRRVDR